MEIGVFNVVILTLMMIILVYSCCIKRIYWNILIVYRAIIIGAEKTMCTTKICGEIQNYSREKNSIAVIICIYPPQTLAALVSEKYPKICLKKSH